MSKQPAKKSTVKKTASKKAMPAKKTAAAKVVKKKPSPRSAAKEVAAKKGRPKKSAPAKRVVGKKGRPRKTVPAKPSTRKPATKSKQQHSPAKAAAAAAASETNAETKSIPEVDVSAPFSGGFTLDDVRSVLDTKKSDTVKKKATTAPPKSKAKPTPKPTKKAPIKKKAAAASITDILGFNPKKSSTAPDRDESKVPTKWKPFYRSLLKIRTQLKEALGDHSEETIGASARESSGELSVNSPDAGSESFDRDVALSMVAGEQETLQEVEAAIDRLFEGTYGVCQETGKPIKQTRLRAVPFTRFSLEGQALYEQRGSKGRDKVGGVFATLSEASLGDDQA